MAPKRTTYVPPKFEPGAKGIVVLELLIDPDGAVKRVKTKSGHPKLAAQAAEAARQWRYEPTLYRGQPAWIVLHAMANATAKGTRVPVNIPSTTVNVADPQPVRLYLQGRIREIAQADVKTAAPTPQSQEATAPSRAESSTKPLLKRLDLTNPIQRSGAPLDAHCGELLLKITTNEGVFSKTLLLHRDGLVQDADHPTIVYAQTFQLCSGGNR